LPSLQRRQEFESTDASAGQVVKFITSVEVTGDASAPLPENAFKRLVCHFIVSKLQDRDLDQARDELVEMFLWRMGGSSFPALAAPTNRRQVSRKVGIGPKIEFEAD
jgi:hypothetical protein